MRRSLFILGVILSSSAAIAETLVVYSGRKEKFVKPVIEQFSQDTGIKVILHNAKAGALVQQLKLEGRRTKADLFLSNDVGTLEKGAQAGLFATLPAENLAKVDPRFVQKARQWVGLSARLRVLVVNKNDAAVKDIQSVQALAEPALKGRVAITSSANDSFIGGVTAYKHSWGDAATLAWLQGLKANTGGEYFAKHRHIVAAVAGGKKSVGLVNHYYVYRHLVKNPDAPLRIVYPDQDGVGVALNTSGIAITKHSRNKAAAQKLVDYLLSEKAQQPFAAVNREYPTVVGVKLDAMVTPMSAFKTSENPLLLLGRERQQSLDLIETSGLP